MHNFVLKIFEFVKNIIKFIQILFLICISLTLLYWIQNITNAHWGWMSFCAPFLDVPVCIGKIISNKSITLLGAIFEYKYFIAIVLYVVLYYLGNLLSLITSLCEKFYLKCHQTIKKTEENLMNKSLQKQEEQQKNMLKTYKVYVSVAQKKNDYGFQNVDLDEQNQIMNKFLTEKTGIVPIVYSDGFLYVFDSFQYIDNTIDIFAKIFRAGLPLNYYVCIQAFGLNQKTEEKLLNNLIKLKLTNKIITSSDTIWHYNSILQCRYEPKTLGLFQKNGNSYEVFEFLPKE